MRAVSIPLVGALDPFGCTLPPNWTLETIGSVCDRSGGGVQTGPFGSQLHAEDYVPDGIPSVMPKDIVGDRISERSIARVSAADARRLAVHQLRVGDIVYARRGDIGRRALVREGEEGWLCGTGCLRIRLNEPEIAPEYVLAYLGHPVLRKWVEDRAQGATMLNLNTTILRGVPLRLPPLSEQRRIAEILDQADALRAKRRAALAQLDTLTQAIFLEMFGDPARQPSLFSKRPLGEMCGVDAALVDPTLPEYADLPHYGPDRIERDTGTLLAAQTAREEGLTSVKFLFDPECILYSKIRPYLNKVALAIGKGLCSADMYPVSVRKGVATREFVWQLLLSRDFLNYAATLSNRANIPKLNKEQFLDYPALCPPFAAQEAFAQRVGVVELVKGKHRAALARLDDLFASLQHRAFRGEL